MHCKRCGKALGTDRGICPFCGAMLSESQMNQYKKDKLEKMKYAELLTEKYGEKPVYYEKPKSVDNKLIILLIVLGILLLLAFTILIFVLNG